MLVREIMSTPAYRVAQDASPHTALALMARAHVTSLPVVDSDGRLVGIVSEADILRYEIQPDPRAHLRPPAHGGATLPASVSELMTSSPHTIRQDADVADLARVFATSSWKSLPVLRGRTLVGVVSRSDVVRALARPDREIQNQVTRRFAQYGEPAWHASVVAGVVKVGGADLGRERALATALAAEIPGVRRVEHLGATSKLEETGSIRGTAGNESRRWR